MREICNKNKCTGCSTCLNSCPKKCITMEEDEYGVLMPHIDENKCINCNICKKVCPENNKIDLKEPLKVYAGWSLDENVRKKSSSGGIAWEMYQYIIQHGGIAVGTKFDNEMNLSHQIATNLEELEGFRGSKYIQSSIGTIFTQLKPYVEQNRKIIFIGTPCQVNGLKSFFKNKNIENIITVDLICHGVPTTKYLKEYIKYLKLNNKIDEVTFRGENNWYFTGYKKGKVIYKKHNKEDFFYKSFLNGLFYRENCYQCRYARKERVGDITIGDFWGLGKDIPFNYPTEDGTSVILVNTEKGQDFIQKLDEKIFLVERSLEEALKGNKQLNYPSSKNKNTLKFKETYKMQGFEQAMKNIEN